MSGDRSEYQRAWYEANKEAIKAKAKQYREQNKEKIKEWQKAHYEINKEGIKAKSKEWHKNNRDQARERAKRYREDNRERLAQVSREYYESNKEVLKEKVKQYRLANLEKVKETKKLYAKANQEQIKTSQKAYREANRERLKEKDKEYYRKNIERFKDERKKYLKEYFNTEHGKTIRRVQLARRRSSQLQRTPYWLTEADLEKIRCKYAVAQRKTDSTGEKWVVDHIIPLKGKFVSGLHVPANLRVVKNTTNCRKSNHFDIDKEWALS